MITNETLYHTLMRTASLARRMPTNISEPASERERLPRGRGFGHILDLLSQKEGICQQQIAQMAGIRPQSVSEAIGILETRGLIRKESGVEDRRTFLIFLTEEGESYRQRNAKERKIKAERLFGALSHEEKESLYALLQKIREAQKEEKE